MTIHEIWTELQPQKVIDRARCFFALAGTPSAAFTVESEPGYLRLHMEAGEIVLAAMPQSGGSWVRGSASRAPQMLTAFLITLARATDVKQTVERRGVKVTHAAAVESFTGVALPASVEEPERMAVPHHAA
ncbi:MAG: hypothetical protein WD737_12385 [Gemmatimonadota bacterium]